MATRLVRASRLENAPREERRNEARLRSFRILMARSGFELRTSNFARFLYTVGDWTDKSTGGIERGGMERIEIIVNGDRKEIEAGSTVEDLVRTWTSMDGPLAVEVNEHIVSRNDWTELRLSGGDRVEIVHFVGGGREDRCPTI